MKKIIIVLVVLLVVYLLISAGKRNRDEAGAVLPEITPVEHASFVMTWGDTVIYNDPVGGAAKYASFPRPDLILLSDIHGDHLHTETLVGVLGENTLIVAPAAVAERFDAGLLLQTLILQNGETAIERGFSIEAIPMYNLPESADSRHTKGRGNGYVIEKDGMRVYIAGDTADIPEMRALTDIDIAFVPMNMPFTMDVETAADAVLDFAPKTVIPYHYRGQDGLADVGRFRELVNAGNPDIEVLLLDWYPAEPKPEAPAAETPAPVFSVDLGATATILSESSWQWLETVYADGDAISPAEPERFVLTFGLDGRFSSTTDCNTLNGAYRLSPGAIAFENIASTKMACVGETAEARYIEMLTHARGYIFTADGALALTLAGDAGSVVFEPVR